MANNRMYLVHMPTGLAAPLGKRMGWNWYVHMDNATKLGSSILRLYKVLEDDFAYEGSQDDFALALEDSSQAPKTFDTWEYGNVRSDGLVHLIFKGSCCSVPVKIQTTNIFTKINSLFKRISKAISL